MREVKRAWVRMMSRPGSFSLTKSDDLAAMLEEVPQVLRRRGPRSGQAISKTLSAMAFALRRT
jgi:hypothetical protein